MSDGVQSQQQVVREDRVHRLARIRRQLVAVRIELSKLQAYHAADLVGAAVNHLDRKDDARGNV